MLTTLVQNFARADIADSDLPILQQYVFWLQISVSNANSMHFGQAVEDLSSVLFDLSHTEIGVLLFQMSEYILQASVTEFEHCILNDPLLLVDRVKEIEHLDNILFTFEHIKNLIFPRNNITSFLSPLESDSLLSGVTLGLKNISYKTNEIVRFSLLKLLTECTISYDSNWC